MLGMAARVNSLSRHLRIFLELIRKMFEVGDSFYKSLRTRRAIYTDNRYIVVLTPHFLLPSPDTEGLDGVN